MSCVFKVFFLLAALIININAAYDDMSVAQLKREAVRLAGLPPVVVVVPAHLAAVRGENDSFAKGKLANTEVGYDAFFREIKARAITALNNELDVILVAAGQILHGGVRVAGAGGAVANAPVGRTKQNFKDAFAGILNDATYTVLSTAIAIPADDTMKEANRFYKLLVAHIKDKVEAYVKSLRGGANDNVLSVGPGPGRERDNVATRLKDVIE